MEEIGLQFETRQDALLSAVRRYVSSDGRRLIEECPLRAGLKVFHAPAVPESPRRPMRPESANRGSWRSSHLAALFETYFDYYFAAESRRSLIVAPTVGRWTGLLYGQRAIDCKMLQWLSTELSCRAVGFCFVEDTDKKENEEFSYIEFVAGRIVEVFSSIFTDGGGHNFWSAGKGVPPPEGPLITNGFLKEQYQFIPGFYDLPFVRGRKNDFTCYRFSAFPDLYDEKDNFSLSSFRFFYFDSDNARD